MSGNSNFDFKTPSTRSVLSFLFMPEFRRSAPAFAHIGPIFIRTVAIMFVQAGLLRPNHPAMMHGLAQNVPKFKFSDLVGEAWFNLRTGDGVTPYQYGVFAGVIMMICLSITTAVIFLLNFFVSSAQAQIFDHPIGDSSLMTFPGGTGLFQTSSSNDDLAIDILNKVVRMAAYDTGAPLSHALGALMGVYNTALLVIASIIIFWAILAIVIDTARTGQIGGGRHSIVWVPIRFVFALGLMIPFGTGFSGGQFIILKIAEWGSNLGTNGWVAYVEQLTNDTMVANVHPRPSTDLAVSLARVETCRLTYNALNDQGTGLVDTALNAAGTFLNPFEAASTVYTQWSAIFSGDFQTAFDPNIRTKIVYRYQGGMIPSTDNGTLEKLNWDGVGMGLFSSIKVRAGNLAVPDYCGTITIDNPNYFPDFRGEVMTTEIKDAVQNLKTAHYDAFFDYMIDPAYRTGCGLTYEFNEIEAADYCTPYGDTEAGNGVMPNGTSLERAAIAYYLAVENATDTAHQALNTYMQSPAFFTELQQQGWAGMGVWYFKIQNVNAALDAAMSPTVTITPGSLESHSRDSLLVSLFKDKEQDEVLKGTADTMAKFDAWWTGISMNASPDQLVGQLAQTNAGPSAGASTGGSGSFNIMMKKIFGGYTLIDLGEPGEDLYPMTELISIGNMLFGIGVGAYMTIAAISAAAIAVATAGIGFANGPLMGLNGIMSGPIGDLISTLVMLMIVAGAALKFYIPLLPWIRVTFAVLSWIVSVFEAVVIVPLLALANLSTEGEGLFTQSARNLWVSALNILLRPILTVIGFIAALLIFNAMVGYVNNTFEEAIVNSISVGMFFWLSVPINSAIYVFVIFTLANATFKTVDMLPNAVMRWMGGPQDNDFQDSSIEGFIGAAGQHTSRMAGSMSSNAGAAKKALQEAKKPKGTGAQSQ